MAFINDSHLIVYIMPNTQQISQTQSTNKGKIKRILLPTDFSESSHNAYLYGLRLAEDMGANITLFHAYQDTPAETEYMPRTLVEAIRNEKIDFANERFDTYLEEAQHDVGPHVEVEVILESGRAVNQICEVCGRIGADLILMGTRGAASPFEQILGSITHQVIQLAEVPVLAIPAEAVYEPLRVMMYAMGIEEVDFKVLARLKEIADLLGAKVICTHVKKDTDTWARLDLQMLNEIYQMEKEGEIEFYVTQFHNVMHGLHRFVTEHQVDWLVMTTHESSQIRHLFDPSLTRQMVLYTDVPLLAFHA